jgi:hypothetical protein
MIAVTVTATHIGVYERHAIHLQADVRRMNETEWTRFRNSVGEFGLRYPIVRWEKKILSGANRLLACLETGQPPWFCEFEELPMFRRCKTRPDQEAAARKLIEMEDLDRRQLNPGEIAAVLVRLYPPLPRGRPSKTSGNADQENPPNGGIKRPSDEKLARQSGISPRTLQRAREESEDEKLVREGCVKEIQEAVGKEFSARDAANLRDLDPKEQRKILKYFRETKPKPGSLTIAMTHLRARNPNLPGMSVKSDMHLVRIEEWVPAETPDLAVDSAKRMALDLLERRGIDPEKYSPVVTGVGLKVGGIKSFTPCVRCGFLLYSASPQKKTAQGPACKECPDGRARD